MDRVKILIQFKNTYRSAVSVLVRTSTSSCILGCVTLPPAMMVHSTAFSGLVGSMRMTDAETESTE